MFLLISYIIIILLNLKFSKSKILYIIDFMFMWILMGWNYSVADYDIYLIRYTHPEIYGTLEPLYVVFQNIGKMMGLSYDTFLAYMSFIFLLIRMVLIKSMSMRPNYVVGLYLLFPFIMDITQIRMFYATTIVLIGIFILIKNYKYCNILFVVTVILATMIHAACIIYILILVAKNVKSVNIKEYLQVCVLVCGILYALLPTGVLYSVLALISRRLGFGKKFIETVFSTSMAYKFTNKITYMIEIILFFGIIYLILKRATKGETLTSGTKEKELTKSFSNLELLHFCIKVNCSLLIILPLAWYSGDIYRVQHGIVILFYTALSNLDNFRGSRRGMVKLNQLLVAGFITIFMILFLIGLPSLREAVFMPVFFENGLLG